MSKNLITTRHLLELDSEMDDRLYYRRKTHFRVGAGADFEELEKKCVPGTFSAVARTSTGRGEGAWSSAEDVKVREKTCSFPGFTLKVREEVEKVVLVWKWR